MTMTQLTQTKEAIEKLAQVIAHVEPVSRTLGVRQKLASLKLRALGGENASITVSYSKEYSPLRKHIQAAVSTGQHAVGIREVFRAFGRVRYPVQDYLDVRVGVNQREIINQVASLSLPTSLLTAENANKPQATHTLNANTFQVQKIAVREDHTAELLRFSDFETYWEAWATLTLTEHIHRYILSQIQPLNAVPPYPGAGSIPNPNVIDLAQWVGLQLQQVFPQGATKDVLVFIPPATFNLAHSLKDGTANYLIPFNKDVSRVLEDRGIYLLPYDDYTPTPAGARYFAFRRGDVLVFVDDNITLRAYPLADDTVEANRIRTVAEVFVLVVPLRTTNVAANMLVYGDTLANAFANM